jgi:glycosyltransferase involved in cell wall biosynthesis
MSEPRVAFLIHGLVVGGAEKFFISLVNDFYRSGHDPVVILLSDENALFPELDPGVNSIIIKRKFKYDLRVGAQIKNVLDEHKIEKVFCVGIFSFFLMKLYSRSSNKRTFFLSLHSTIPATKKEHFLNYLYFRSISAKDRVIFICNAQKDYLGKKYFFKPKNSEVIYNGINTTYFTPCQEGPSCKPSLREKFNLPVREKLIVNIARMFPEKGHKYGIDALGILHEKFACPAHLVFVGSGDPDYSEKTRQYATKSPVAPYIHFIEHQKDVRPLHRMADVFTLTSYSIETFSLAALEAMSSGVPCSLTNIGGASEMIFDHTGKLSQSKDPLSIANSWFELLQTEFDPVSLHNYVAENFSLDQMLANYKKAVFADRLN